MSGREEGAVNEAVDGMEVRKRGDCAQGRPGRVCYLRYYLDGAGGGTNRPKAQAIIARSKALGSSPALGRLITPAICFPRGLSCSARKPVAQCAGRQL